MSGGPSALVAFVRSSQETGDSRIKICAEGPILWATGDFLKELNETGSWEISDDPPPGGGLHLFEGWIEVGFGEDPDVTWVRSWRQLTHWEIYRMRFGKPPYGEDTPLPIADGSVP